jgi:glycerophosphoryl diester phosphodiesterase
VSCSTGLPKLTSLSYKNLPSPAIFAHRGSSAHAPENTLASFQLALTQGAPALELDAMLCADGHVVVIHDDSVDRTTNGLGKVRNMTLAAIKELDAGSYYDVAFKGERVPTLSEVFETLGRRIFINIEIKNYASPLDNLPSQIASLVQKFNLGEFVLFSSFNPLALLKLRCLLPQVPSGLLIFHGIMGGWARGWLGRRFPCQAFHPDVRDVTPAFIESTHQTGRRMHVYTVNEPEDMKRLFALGVDGIFTDDPPLALNLLK